ncbi:MAG: hypothetical protein H6704_30890 [Myxococcales bacterium]|nr:hypothetical protein [Myxococcales bacterium]MCB9540649.1 hypothetical protein [Myxococcales bacterium]
MKRLRIFLAGEGRHELGGWWHEAPYVDPAECGVLEALVRRVAADDIEVVGARMWSKAGHYRSGGRAGREERTVVRLFLDAAESGADVLVFVRDVDAYDDRTDEVDSGMKKGAELEPGLSVVGGVAVRVIEGWLLALRQERQSERWQKEPAKDRVKAVGLTCTADMVECVRAADLDRLPPDAHSLRAWLDQARAVFASQQPPSQR